MSMPSKLTTERNQKALLELVLKPGNDICADCKVRNPRWASHNLGIFICVNCASIHRKIGTHITKVKSLTMDSWTKDQVEIMRNNGNVKSNAIYNPNEIRHPPPPNLEDSERDSELEQYIRGKYEYRKFIDKNALVASKLGPSRSASSIPPRSAASLTTGKRSSTLSTSSSPASEAPSSFSSKASSIPPSQSQPSPASVPAKSTPFVQPRLVSQPVVAQKTQTDNKPKGGVWDDLIQLQDPTPSSSLPLQFQQQSPSAFGANAPFSQNVTGMNGMSIGANPTGMGMSVNPFQQQAFSTNPYSQQTQTGYQGSPLPSPFIPSQFTSNIPQVQQSYGQQLFMSQMGQQSPNLISAPVQGQYFQPQPQSSLQVQNDQQQMFLSPSPSQPMMSAPVNQTHFMTPSPSQQFLSHSPQLQLQGQATSNQFMSSSPQLIGQQSHSAMPMVNSAQGQYGTGMGSAQPQNSFLQSLPAGMMSPAQYSAGLDPGQTFRQQNAFNYQAGQQQWGTM